MPIRFTTPSLRPRDFTVTINFETKDPLNHFSESITLPKKFDQCGVSFTIPYNSKFSGTIHRVFP